MTRHAPRAFADRLARLDDEPIVVTAGRTKMILLLVGAVGFVGFGLTMIATDEEGALWVPAVIMVALGGVFALARLARPPVLTVSRDGVQVKTMLRAWSVRWDETQAFFVYRAPVANPATGLLMNEMAAFNWSGTPATSGPRKTGRLGRFSGVDGGFGSDWSISARDLTDLLNAARERALGAPDPAEPPDTSRG